MIAIDLDGTLLRPDGTVSARVKAAVRGAADAGLVVCIATGRNHGECRDILETVGHRSAGVFVGGAVVVDCGVGRTLHRSLMGADLAAGTCRLIEAAGLPAMALQEGQGEDAEYLITDGIELNEPTRQWMSLNLARIRRVPGLADQGHPHTVRVSICATGEQCAAVERTLRASYGERIVCHTLMVTAYGVKILEVFDRAVDKWTGILRVAAVRGIGSDEIIAVGDDVNDLPMIRNAALGVAMGNARPEVIAVADRVIGSNAEDGLAAFLEEWMEGAASRGGKSEAGRIEGCDVAVEGGASLEGESDAARTEGCDAEGGAAMGGRESDAA